jgi:hypothetical protein
MLTASQAKVSALEREVTTIRKELFTLKENFNSRDQADRVLTVRVLGLHPTEDEANGPDPSKAAAKTAYDRVLKPLLQAAKDKGIISTIPSITNTVETAYRMKMKTTSSSSGPPPLIVIRLILQNIKSSLFKVKKDALPSPTEDDRAKGVKRLLLVEDLTPDTYNFLKTLREDPRVLRAWTVDGRVRYAREGDESNWVHKVDSIYKPIDIILK